MDYTLAYRGYMFTTHQNKLAFFTNLNFFFQSIFS